MRILIVVHGFPPDAHGGSELYADAHARGMAGTFGDQVVVLTREQDPERPEYAVRREVRQGVTILRINNTFRNVRSFRETYANDEIARIADAVIDEFKPQVAHIHHLTCLSTKIVDSLAQRGIPIVFTLHDYWLMCHRGQLLNTAYERCDGPGGTECGDCLGPEAGAAVPTFALAAALRVATRRLPSSVRERFHVAARRSSALLTRRELIKSAARERADTMRAVCALVTEFIAPSRNIRDRFIDFGVPVDRITVSDYGIDVTQFRRADRESSDRLRLGFLGSVMISKGPHLLLEAFQQIPHGRASVDLFGGFTPYHGDSSYWQRIEPLLGVPGVRAHGAWPHERVAEALASIDVLVVPSIWPENAAFVIREAFAAGLPVVASRIGGTPEVVRHGINGLLFEPDSVEDLRRMLLRLIDEPGLLAALGRGVFDVRCIEDDVVSTRDIYERLTG